MQLALSPEEAQRALAIGARMIAHGFSDRDLDGMVVWEYSRRAEVEQAVASRTATVSQVREFFARRP